MTPFVKWAGGKTQLLGELKSRVPGFTGTYYEPFLGGGAMLLSLCPVSAVVSDKNAALANAYDWIKRDVDALLHELYLLNLTLCDEIRYKAYRECYNEHRDENTAEMAALFIWLNKHAFNGLYRVNKKGEFNVPWNRKAFVGLYDELNLREISDYLNGNHVIIENGDFEEICSSCRPGDFVYFDSPYVPAGKTSDFTSYTMDGFGREDHVRLRDLFEELSRQGVKCMLSNNDTEFVRELYDGYRIDAVAARRNINADGANRKGREVIIMNY